MGISIKRIIGALLLVYGSVLLVWVGYNLFVETTSHFAGRRVGGAAAMITLSLVVGWNWVRGRPAFDDTDGEVGSLPPEVAPPEVEAAFPGSRCRRCRMVRLLALRDGKLWCRLCHDWVATPPQGERKN